jgi:5-methylcytosine-specific restriction enzyme A
MLTRRSPRRTYRQTGPASDVVEVVLERAGYSCEACGSAIGDRRGVDWSVQHRRPRKMGGTRWPGANLPSNLMILCGSATTPGSCHEFAENQRTAAEAAGWLVRAGVDPATEPVLIVGGRFVYLDDAGRYLDEPAVVS